MAAAPANAALEANARHPRQRAVAVPEQNNLGQVSDRGSCCAYSEVPKWSDSSRIGGSSASEGRRFRRGFGNCSLSQLQAMACSAMVALSCVMPVSRISFMRSPTVTASTVALQSSDGARMASSHLAFRNLLDRKGEVGVAGCRDRSRPFATDRARDARSQPLRTLRNMVNVLLFMQLVCCGSASCVGTR